MNAKTITILGGLGLLAAGAAFYCLDSQNRAGDPIAPTAPTTAAPEVSQPKAAELVAAKEPVAEAPLPQVAKDLPPKVKVIPHKDGDLYMDMQTRIITQEKKILLKKMDGSVSEMTVMITAKPIIKPLSMVQLQAQATNTRAPGSGHPKKGWGSAPSVPAK